MSDLFKDLIIFEMANNHQGDVNHGIRIIRKLGEVTKKYGINAAIKFQYRDLDTIIHPDYKNKKDVKHISRFLSTRLTKEQFYQMVQEARSVGLHTMCTPFDEKSVDLICEHSIEIIKIASCSAIDWPLLQKVSEAKKPVIVSTGGKTLEEIDNIYSFFMHRVTDFAMLHCVGMYPVKEEDVNLAFMKKMQERYLGVPIGYSGHENPNNMSIAQMAIAMGANIMERHVGLATDIIKLNAYSTDVNKIDSWIEAILSARKIYGNDKRIISKDELQSMNELARGCYAANAIKKDSKIDDKDVFFAIPRQNGQTTSGEFKTDMVATKNYEKNEPLFENSKVTLVKDTRSIIHDIRGMLYEAKIVVGDKFSLELSHHYGLELFRRFGATIINIINREYCKKYIIMLPEQQHPTHYHKIKEESFQIMSGDLLLTLNGISKLYHPGDVVTVERGVKHAFSSKEGCIFEEISTTHVKNDSFYDDQRIACLDLMERKTILENW